MYHRCIPRTYPHRIGPLKKNATTPISLISEKFIMTIFIFFSHRGHLEDIYDLAWSPNGTQLVSGSVDNSAIIWDVDKGENSKA